MGRYDHILGDIESDELDILETNDELIDDDLDDILDILDDENLDDFDDIDNTDVVYNDSFNRLYVRTNNKGHFVEHLYYHLDQSLARLARKYEEIAKLKETMDDPLDYIVKSEFADGFVKDFYIRNLSYTRTEKNGSQREVRVLGIRPVRTPGSMIDKIMPQGHSLIFKGRINGPEFIVDEIYDTTDDERLKYEGLFRATCYGDFNKVKGFPSRLYDLADESHSLVKHTQEKLGTWREYLNWKREIVEKKIYGWKYINVEIDQETGNLVFVLIAKTKEDFDKIRKVLKREDIFAYGNAYSTDRWEFKYNRDAKRQRRGLPLGKFRGIKEEAYREINLKAFETEEIPDDYDTDLESEIQEEYDMENDPEYSNLENWYVVKVAFEPEQDDVDKIRDIDPDDVDALQDAYDSILNSFYPEGFLSISAVGSLTLINRLNRALNDLENDFNCSSPNLALWIFDVTKARVPNDIDVEIDKWLNKGVAANEHQVEAVKKMLAAPDLCMIQGPPGTGKTTVIAEAIYQFVRQGKRVLITSQSNDAVDNALERLLNSPEIRAIRLGRKGRVKYNKNVEDIEENKYSENLALKCFYHSVSEQIREKWLDRWGNFETQSHQFELDLRNTQLLQEKILEKIENGKQIAQDVRTKKSALDSVQEYLETAQRENNNTVDRINQLNILKDVFFEGNNAAFRIDSDDIEKLFYALNTVMKSAKSVGINIVDTVVDYDRISTAIVNGYVEVIIRNLGYIKDIIARLDSAKSGTEESIGKSIEIQKAKQQFAIIQEQLDNLDPDDDLEMLRLYKLLQKTKKEIKQLEESSDGISLPSYEKAVLSDSLLGIIASGKNLAYVRNKLSNFVIKFNECAKNVISSLIKSAESRELYDLEVIKSSLLQAQKAYDYINEIYEESRNDYKELIEELKQIGAKYNVENALDANAVIKEIQSQISDLAKTREKESVVKDVWEDSLTTFVNKLNDDENYANDLKYYQRIYVNACNVVGISCTDNMKELIDNGFDEFDVVIIDEVSKATPPELIIPLLKANKAILVGDHRQLPPMFDEHERSYKEIVAEQEENPDSLGFKFNLSDYKKYEKMITASMFKDFFEHADDRIRASLLTQYRMHSDISRVINRFYENMLENGLSQDQENSLRDHGVTVRGVDGFPIITPDKHAYWIDSSQLPNGKLMTEVFRNNSTSASNIYEAYLIIEMLRKIAEDCTQRGYNKKHRKTVGVISFYMKQVSEIRRMFRQVRKDPVFNSIDVAINTVDRFQGKEKNIIITSLVRNNRTGRASSHIVAFERINVAFSRAQEMLLVVGAKHLYEKQLVELPGMLNPNITTTPVYQNIISDMQRRGAYVEGGKLVTPELENKILAEYEKVRVENENR